MSIKYHVRLTDDEREMLEALIKQEKPKVAQHKKRRAGILLAIDENQSLLTHEQFAKAFRVRPVTICRLRQCLVEEGMEAAVNGKHAGNSHKRKLDGEGQVYLIATAACSPPPEGRCRWALNLLRDKMVELKYVDKISRSTVYAELKKTNLNLG